MISIPIPASRTSFASVRRLYVFKASLVILLVAICWFGTLDMRALFSPDEGRYAEIPRENAGQRRLDHTAAKRP